MLGGLPLRWLPMGVIVLMTGCASDTRNMLSNLQQHRGDVELIETPFYPQVTDQCGPSALAVVLNSSGIAVLPETLKSRVYIPGRQGSLQIELLAAARGYGRMPYLIDTNVSALVSEVRAGRPVLVLQNLGSERQPVWHYAVVIGYLADQKRFVLRSGDQKRHVTSASRFARTWQKAGYWGVLVLEPGEFPAMPNADNYVRSVAALEAIGDFDSAWSGYIAATERWPLHSLAWLGLGNTLYSEGRLESAAGAYGKLLALESHNLIGLNNLSQVQMEQGLYTKADATLDNALSIAEPNTAIYAVLQESRREIASRKSAVSVH